MFVNDFLDHKDSGTAILSHFYLLTGCAGSLWLDGYVLKFFITWKFIDVISRPSKLLQYTGILALGLGDAAVSCP